jgi:Rha family phage regulatory protein
MKDLEIIKQHGQLIVESRQVAEMVDKPHNDLMKSIRQYCDYLGQGNFSLTDFFIESTYLSEQKKVLPCYLITKKGCDMVANKMTGEKGILFTATYVTRFEEMEKQLTAPQIPQTLPEALRAYATEVENHIKAKALIEEQKPKVLFADSVAGSHNSILINELAKILHQKGVQVGQNRLFKLLREQGYLCKQAGENYNLPTQRSMDLGVMEVKKSAVVTGKGDTFVTRTTKITPKGQLYFVNHFLNAGKLEVV